MDLGEAKRSRLDPSGGEKERHLHFVAPGDVITTDTGFMRSVLSPRARSQTNWYLYTVSEIVWVRVGIRLHMQGPWDVLSGRKAAGISCWSSGKS